MNCHDPFYFFLIAFKFINNLFRTPLNGIIGIIDINSKSSDMELIEENRQKARCAAQQLLSLLNEVLDMSRLEHGPPLSRIRCKFMLRTPALFSSVTVIRFHPTVNGFMAAQSIFRRFSLTL